MGGTAWVTLATNDSYALGALVVANSLKKVNTVHDLAILITPGVTLAMKNQLLKVFNFVKEVDVFDSKDESNLRLLARPDLGITFTKIHAWRLTQYTKCVFLDADVLIVQNCDELFDREELSAAPDAGWPDCFNSGVFVFKPSDTTYNALVEFALVNGSFDGGDQGLLNLFFSDWATADIAKHLPFVYNMCSTSTYSYLPALKQFGSRVKIIHFIGSSKPWLQQFDASTGSVKTSSSHLSNFLQLWWDIFCKHVHPTLSTEMSIQRLSSLYNTSSVELMFEQYFPSNPSHSEQTYRPLSSLSNSTETYTFVDPWEHLKLHTNRHNIEDFIQNNGYIEHQGHNYHTYEQDNTNVAQNSSHTHHHHQRELHDSHQENVTHYQHSYHAHNDNHHHEDRHNHQVRSDHEAYNHSFQNHHHQQQDSSHQHSPFTHSSQSHSNFISPHTNDLSNHVEPFPPPSNDACSSSCALTLTNHHDNVEPIVDETLKEDQNCEVESGLARALAQVPVGTPISAEQLAYEDHMHRQHWEEGHIDYLGKDSWDNIWKKISQTIEPEKSSTETPAAPSTEAPAPKTSPVEAAPIKPTASVEAAPPKVPTPVETVPPKPSAPVEAVPPTAPAPLETVQQAPSTHVQSTPTQDVPATVQSTPTSVQTDTTPAKPVPIKSDEPKPETKADVTQLIPSQTPAVATTVGTPKLSTSVASFDEEPIVSAPVIVQAASSTPESAQPVPPIPSEQKEQTVESPQSPSVKTPETPATPVVPVSTEIPATPTPISVAPLEPKSEVKPEPIAANTPTSTPASTPTVPPAAALVSLSPNETTSTISTPQVKPEPISPVPAKTEEPASDSKTSSQPSSVPTVPQVTPSTPTVTAPSPPESPLSAVSVKLEKLDIDPSIPATPPAGADVPVPPKRKGGKGSGPQGQASPSQSEQPKGGKGKGKK